MESKKNRINNKIEKINKEINYLEEIKKKFDAQKEIDKKAEKRYVKTIIAIDAMVAAAISSAMALTIDHGNDNIFRDYDILPEYVTESVDNTNNPDTIVRSTHKTDLIKKDDVKINFMICEKWVKYEDYYKRDVVTYEVNADKALKDYYQQNINEISEQTISDLNYKKINSYTEESFNVSEEELNKTPYIRMTATYKDKLVQVKETPKENLAVIPGWILGFLVTGLVGVFVAIGIEDFVNRLELTKKKEKEHFKKYYTVNKVDDSNIDTIIKMKENAIRQLEYKKYY